jgi:non-ribosomal peptide synthetase-like protein
VRRIVYSVVQLLGRLVVVVPLGVGAVVMVIEAAAGRMAIMSAGPDPFTSWAFYGEALAVSAVVFTGLVLAGLLAVVAVGPVLNLAVLPDRVYPLYGVQYAAHRVLAGLSNRRFFTYLFGDSAAIVHYLRGAGYDLLPLEQTGSNFGLDVQHDNPYLTSVGRGTMVADGLSVINADVSATSFRVSRAAIGPRNFVGNYVAYPSQSRTGANCLLATKVMVPIDGEIREGVGLLGSPSMEIPRSVLRDSQFDHLRQGEELRRRLAAKTRYNAGTMALYLLKWWVYLFAVVVLIMVVLDLDHALGAWVLGPAGVAMLAFSVIYFALVERAGGSFRNLQPRHCSIYEPYFWWHERYWKLSTQPGILDGTPFKPLVWRLLGVRMGRRVFDDGCIIMEKTLVSIGDDCALNAGSIVQPHSQEDGAFKADRIAIGSGCTLGVAALVHYGVTMGERAVLAPDSFLMKGEEIPARARWGGNPAREIRATTVTP